MSIDVIFAFKIKLNILLNKVVLINNAINIS